MPPSSEAMAWAVKAWTTQLGQEHVLLERARIRPAQRATFPTKSKVIAVLRPADASQIAGCLRIAAAHEVPVKPVSGGARWGYGSRTAVAPYVALLDLSRMTALSVDATLGTVTVEPGVSVIQVQEELVGTRWLWSGPGSTPYASVLGNAVDGGVCEGQAPLRRRSLLSARVVLSSGDVVDVGDPLGRGLGPDLTDVFVQTNFGVVVRATFALQRAPANHAALHLGLADSQLESAIDAVRELRADELLSGCISLHSTLRVVCETARAPEDTPPDQPVASTWLDRWRDALGGHHWHGEAAVIAATPQHLDAAINASQTRLLPHADSVVVHRGGAVPHAVQGLGCSVESAYWRHAAQVTGPGKHPDRDGLGFLLFTPVLALVGSTVVEAVDGVRTVVAEHGFDAVLTLRVLDHRSVSLWTALSFDRSRDAAAVACHDALLTLAAQQHWRVPRPGQRGRAPTHTPAPGHAALMQQLKQWLDPADVIAPGEGDERPHWTE